MQVSHGQRKDVKEWVLQKILKKGLLLGKMSLTQIPTSLPISLNTTSTTTTTRPLTKGITINEGAGGSSSSLVPPTSNVDPRNKGKAIYVVL